jgi:hypothetical protein
MNKYILIRRLRGPAILLLLGIVALLHEADLIDFWGMFIPLLLILIGVLKLAERAALAAAGDEVPYPGSAYPYGAAAQPAPQPQPGTAMVPTQNYGNGREGGQS